MEMRSMNEQEIVECVSRLEKAIKPINQEKLKLWMKQVERRLKVLENANKLSAKD